MSKGGATRCAGLQEGAAVDSEIRCHVRLLRIFLGRLRRLGFGARRAVNGFTDALIGAAAADVAAHGRIDISVGGIRFLGEQGDGGHDLPGLAVAALGNIFFDPGLLDGVAAVGGKAFDGGDFLSGDGRDGR